MEPTGFKTEATTEMIFIQKMVSDYSADGKLAIDLSKMLMKSVDLALPKLFEEVQNAKRKGEIPEGHICLRLTLSLGNVEAFKEDEDEED